MEREPRPGEWMQPDEFAAVVRLTPLVAIDLILRSPDDRILVGLRTQEPAKGVWFVPGSRICKNERIAAAFRRVSREELGVELKMEEGRFLGAYEHFYRTNRLLRPGFGTHYITPAYEIARFIPLTDLPKDQHDEYRWLRIPEMMESPEVHENTKAYFR